MPHSGKVGQQKVFFVFGLIIGMDVVSILVGQMIIPSSQVQGLGRPDGPEVKSYIPFWSNVSGKGDIHLVSVSATKKCRKIGEGRFGIVILHAVRGVVIQIIDMKSGRSSYLLGHSGPHRAGGGTQTAQILVRVSPLWRCLIVVETP